MKHIYKILLIIILFSYFKKAECTQIIALSCSIYDVQTSVDKSNTGDTILIPSGTAEWTTKLDIPDEKKLFIKGFGNTFTVISSNMSNEVIDLNLSGSRISQIGFILHNGDGIGILVRGTGWRVDHCIFKNTDDNTLSGVQSIGFSYETPPRGVIDHCEFYDARVVVLGDLSLMANKIWAEPLGLGTDNAVFVEDCHFTRKLFGNVIDANYGGRYVFRYNTVNDAYFESHAVQGNNRSARSWEIYNNTINQVERDMWVPMFMRGGTGVIFNNTITGTWTQPNIALDYRRSCDEYGDGGRCNGSSPWDGNTPGEAGYPCRDQIGRSTDQYLWTDTTPYPPQELDPAYCWNNKHGENDVVFFVHNCDTTKIHIQENRDYYNNTPKPGYSPFTYPHPLTTEQKVTSLNEKTAVIQNLNVHPMPTKNQLTIHFYNIKNNHIEISVVDLTGRNIAMIEKNNFNSGYVSIKWNSSQLKSGMYFIKLKIDKNMYFKKVIKI